MAAKPYPVRIRGVTYPSAQAAAEALGVHRDTVYTMLRKGRPDLIGTGSKRPGNGSAKTFTIGPCTFPSMRAASRALGRGDRYVQDVMRRGTEEERARLVRRVMEYHAKSELARHRKVLYNQDGAGRPRRRAAEEPQPCTEN